MQVLSWQTLPLTRRVRWIRNLLPVATIFIVSIYQLVIARYIESQYGHLIHYSVEIIFYSFVGPIVTWLAINWIENKLIEQDILLKKVNIQTQQLASLAEASADAIISLDKHGKIISWNLGAENIFGYKELNILNHPLDQILPDTRKLEDKIKPDGSIQDYETIAIDRLNRKISVSLTQTLIASDLEDVPVRLIIIRDITTRREKELILSQERARIARDLHDGVAQTLYFLALKADMAQDQPIEKYPTVKEDLREIAQQSRRVIKEIRRTIFSLRSIDWPEGDFIPTLQQFVESFAEQMEWQIKLSVNQKFHPPKRLEIILFRLVQESLNNVAKHANAKEVLVNLHYVPNSFITVTIHDDGEGFEYSDSKNNGFGLNEMEERVKQLGGKFDVKSDIQAGTTVSAQLPIEQML